MAPAGQGTGWGMSVDCRNLRRVAGTAAVTTTALQTATAVVALRTGRRDYATGAKRTEARMQDRPGYRDYQRRVPLFFPRPPAGGP